MGEGLPAFKYSIPLLNPKALPHVVEGLSGFHLTLLMNMNLLCAIKIRHWTSFASFKYPIKRLVMGGEFPPVYSNFSKRQIEAFERKHIPSKERSDGARWNILNNTYSLLGGCPQEKEKRFTQLDFGLSGHFQVTNYSLRKYIELCKSLLFFFFFNNHLGNIFTDSRKNGIPLK